MVPYTEKKVLRALKGMGKMKALGIDGFLALSLKCVGMLLVKRLVVLSLWVFLMKIRI